MRYIRVSIPKSRLDPLIYSVPDSYTEISPGVRVLVPLGPRFVTGFTVETDVEPEGDFDVKPVADVLDPENLFSSNLLRLTKWMADYYLVDWSDVLKAALPPALDIRPETMIHITELGESRTSEHALLQILRERKILPLKEIYKLFGHRGTYSQLKSLEDLGEIEIIAEKRKRRRGYNMIEIVKASDPPSSKKELELYDYLRGQTGAVAIDEIRSRFKNASGLIRRMVERKQLRPFWMPASVKGSWPAPGVVNQLSNAQQRALHRIGEGLTSFGVFLLHGVTGSGKTEIYLRVAQKVLSGGKTVMMLVPEIALLPLLARRAEQALQTPMSILHSELGEQERLQEWQNVRKGNVPLVIGTRSAVFAPLQNVGLILIDEEHDGAYKQGEYPRYHARESAIMRATFENCPVLLGSATPSMESFFNAGNGKYVYLSLPERVEERKMPPIHLVDMKEEYRESGDPVFSRLLLGELDKRLKRKEQVLVLQNRRGYAAWLMCRDCGNIQECPHCSVTLTYHKTDRRMRCHYCDYSRLAPSKCEKCGSVILHLFGVGTQKIVERLQKMYPSARIERFDRDATRQKGSIPKILERFALREIDVLVGTQMLAKGHDFPNITLVGVVGADSGIGIPDFRASERLFQLITQVSGRSGRGTQPGLVILQSFHPDHYAIRCSIEQTYEGFYEKEIRFRRLMQFPPFVALANLVQSGPQPKIVLEEAREFGKLILAYKTEAMKMLGPAIAPIARISRLYRFQTLVKSPSRKALKECLRAALEQFQKVRRRSQMSIDIDPYSII